MDSQPEIRLLAAVVSLAVRDLTHRPLLVNKKPVITDEARSACRFLFSDTSNGFLDLLEYDPPVFRDQLIRMMNDTSQNKVAGFDSMDRRAMRQNYKLWSSDYARLDFELPDDESEPDEFALLPPKKRGKPSYRPSTANRSRSKNVR